MKTKDEMKDVPSFNDLVFENRNKEYGAYKIREKYNAALLWALLVSVFFVSASVITPFVIEMGKPIIVKPPIDSNIVIYKPTVIPIDVPDIEKPKPVEIKVKPPVYVVPEVVDSLKIDESNKLLTADELNKTVTNDSVTDEIKTVVVEKIIPPDADKIIDIGFIAVKPFFGTEGDNEFRRWVAMNLVYPPDLLDAGIQGRVFVQFIIEKDGSISNVEVIKSVDPEFSKEAVRVIKSSPKWNPGIQQGEPVRVRFTFPITFTLKQ